MNKPIFSVFCIKIQTIENSLISRKLYKLMLITTFLKLFVDVRYVCT